MKRLWLAPFVFFVFFTIVHIANGNWPNAAGDGALCVICLWMALRKTKHV